MALQSRLGSLLAWESNSDFSACSKDMLASDQEQLRPGQHVGEKGITLAYPGPPCPRCQYHGIDITTERTFDRIEKPYDFSEIDVADDEDVDIAARSRSTACQRAEYKGGIDGVVAAAESA